MADKPDKSYAVAVICVFTLCTGFMAAIWHWPWPSSYKESASLSLWLLMNLSNLGIIFLSLPTLWFLVADIFAVKQAKSWKPLVKYVPALICSLSTPQMFDPWMWAITFVGAS